jgi:hypothetical protein
MNNIKKENIFNEFMYFFPQTLGNDEEPLKYITKFCTKWGQRFTKQKVIKKSNNNVEKSIIKQKDSKKSNNDDKV